MFDANCIFCKIVQGQIPCAKVYEDQDFLAFLDIGPVRPGHALVVPKAHHATLLDLPADLAAGYLPTAQRVARAVLAVTGAAGFNLIMNNFRAAGQLVDHAHFHVIPRAADDGLHFWPQGSYSTTDEMLALAAKISAALR